MLPSHVRSVIPGTCLLLALLAWDRLCEFMSFAHEHGHGSVVGSEEIHHLMESRVRYQITANDQHVRLERRCKREKKKGQSDPDVLTLACEAITQSCKVSDATFAKQQIDTSPPYYKKHTHISSVKELVIHPFFPDLDEAACAPKCKKHMPTYVSVCTTTTRLVCPVMMAVIMGTNPTIST